MKTAVILSGGKSNRFKIDNSMFDKSNYKIGSLTFIEKIVYTLSKCNIPNIYVSIKNRKSNKTKNLNCICDKFKFESPINGILSSLIQIKENKEMIFIPCDMPFIKSDHINYLIKIKYMKDKNIIYFKSSQNNYLFCKIKNNEIVKKKLLYFIKKSVYKISLIWDNIGCQFIEFNDSNNDLRNINYIEDL